MAKDREFIYDILKDNFGFLRIDLVSSSYAGIWKEIDTRFKRIYDKVLAISTNLQ